MGFLKRLVGGKTDTSRTAPSPEATWREQVPLDRVAAIKFLRDRLAIETNPLDRHFMYLELEKTLYKSRDVFASALDEYAETATSHDGEMDGIRRAFVAEWDGIPNLPTYRQMAIIEQKKNNYEAALRWAERGLAVYGDDALRDDGVEDLKVRIRKYEAKLGQ
jgi:hypothetical protein